MTLDMQEILRQLILLFLVMGIGFIANKAKILTEELTKGLSSLLIYVTVPAMLLSSISGIPHDKNTVDVLWLLGLSLITFVIQIAFGFLMPLILGVKPSQVGAYRYMTVFTNSAFMGFPIIEATFGKEALFYAMLYQVPFSVLCYSLGVWMIGGKNSKISPVKLFLNPAALAAVVAILLYLLQIPIPSVIDGALSSLGGITTPGSMLIIGATLGGMSFKQTLRHWRIYPFTILSGVVFPFVLFLLLRPIIADPMMLYVSAAVMAMPVGTTAVILSHQYRGDTETTSAGVLVSTLCSLGTYPLLLKLIEWIG